jgi:hypothetical protein
MTDRERMVEKACEAIGWVHFARVYYKLQPDHPDRVKVDRLAAALAAERDEAEKACILIACLQCRVGDMPHPEPQSEADAEYHGVEMYWRHSNGWGCNSFCTYELRRRRGEEGE